MTSHGPLRARSGGSEEGPLLLMLHGLGANADVFQPVAEVAEDAWPGGWLAPDLPGHGRSPWHSAYSFTNHAESVADLLEPGREVYVLGHSMGGVVGLALAGTTDGVAGVVGLGIKVSWSGDDLARVSKLAAKAPVTFATRDEAVDRFLRVSGLAGPVSNDDPVVDSGVRQVEDGWRLAMDPAGFGVGAPAMPQLIAAAGCPVLLARGEHDPMSSVAELRALGSDAVQLAGLGHNAHVEDPAAVLRLVADLRER